MYRRLKFSLLIITLLAFTTDFAQTSVTATASCFTYMSALKQALLIAARSTEQAKISQGFIKIEGHGEYRVQKGDDKTTAKPLQNHCKTVIADLSFC